MARKTDKELVEIGERIMALAKMAVEIERELFPMEAEDLSALRHSQGILDAANDAKTATDGIRMWVG